MNQLFQLHSLVKLPIPNGLGSSLLNFNSFRYISGVVKFFDSKKGWGIILAKNATAAPAAAGANEGEAQQPPPMDYFVHQKDVNTEGFRYLIDGEEVEFDVRETEKGMQAVNVVLKTPRPGSAGGMPQPRSGFGGGAWNKSAGSGSGFRNDRNSYNNNNNFNKNGGNRDRSSFSRNDRNDRNDRYRGGNDRGYSGGAGGKRFERSDQFERDDSKN